MRVKKLIYDLGVKFRNPSYKIALSELKSSELDSRKTLEQAAFEKIKRLLVFSKVHSAYYKEVFVNSNFDPEIDFNKIEDLNKIPIISKEILINHNSSIDTTGNYKFAKLFFSETSGTSGQTLTFFKNEEWDSFHRASIARGLSWHNVNVWERNGYFWGYSFSIFAKIKTKLLDFLMNRFRVFSYSETDLAGFISKACSAKYLHGYSSMIYEVAREVNKKNIKFDNIKLVKATSEKIYDHYQSEIIKAFGRKAISEYGAAESGIIAFECEHGSMHVNEETCYIEIVNNKIVVTNLYSFSFPIIRYELGDYVKVSNVQCKCGRNHKVVEEILGRVGKNILGNDGKKFPSLTLYYIFKILGTEQNLELNYKAVQNEIGKLDIFIEQKLTDNQKYLVMETGNRYLGDSVDIIVYDGESIHSKNKKLTDFVSTLE
ncbi:capsule biosynthesis protein CapK [Pseudoalteromonas phenolica]|uniref:phenylacetate--CoA ligase family protein n=1 Tax=Pseudoalteromonas phenolica TaxID=161398 RepID=UPI00110B6AEF|nr:phenylacetate--CoA ligase family protein [Pseudoalteromonas phenolica]TMN92350.1 capsule biosynthesis protein CapK [Pseudoalteromonas phenolica]